MNIFSRKKAAAAAPASASAPKKDNGGGVGGVGGVEETKRTPPPAPAPAPASGPTKQAPSKKKTQPSSSSSSSSSYPAPVTDWLATGLLLQAVGSSPVLNNFLTDLSKEYYPQVLLQAQRKDETGIKQVLLQHARNVTPDKAEAAAPSGSPKQGTQHKKKDSASTAPSSSSSPSISWTNTNLTSLTTQPEKGFWEAAKVYGPSLGPTSLAHTYTTPETTDIYTKLQILANYKAFSPLLGEDITGKAAGLAHEWVTSTTWMKKDGGNRFESAKETLTALLENMAQVYPSVRQSLPASVEALKAIKKEASVGKMKKEETLALLGLRVRPLVNEMWAAGAGGQGQQQKEKEKGGKQRQQAAEAALAAVQAAVDDMEEDTVLGNTLRVEREKIQAAIEQAEKEAAEASVKARAAAEAAAAKEQKAKEQQEQTHTPLHDDDDESDENHPVYKAKAELLFWETHLKHHPGLRAPTLAQLTSFRALLQEEKHKEVIREALVTLQQHQRGASVLLPVEVHALQEFLARAALLAKNYTLALGAVEKTFAVEEEEGKGENKEGGTGGKEGLPACYYYSPSALRLKVTILEQLTARDAMAGKQYADIADSHTYTSLQALNKMKEDDRAEEDALRRVNLLAASAVGLYRQLRVRAETEGNDEASLLSLVEQALLYLHDALSMFSTAKTEKEEQEEEAAAGGKGKARGKGGWPLLFKSKEQLLWVQTNRILAIFYQEDCMKAKVENHLDLAITHYNEAILWVAKLMGRSQSTEAAASMLGTVRFELARAYLRRKKDLTDEMAALLILDQCLETMSSAEERAQVCQFKADYLEKKGRKDKSDVDLRAAISSYEKALDCFEKLRGPTIEKEKEYIGARANMQRSIGYVYVALAKLAHAQTQTHTQGQEENGGEKAAEKEGGEGGGGGEDTDTPTHTQPPTQSLTTYNNPDYEKGINKLHAAYDTVQKILSLPTPPSTDTHPHTHTQTQATAQRASFESGQIALALGDLYLQRSKEKRRKNIDKAIHWYEKTDHDLRHSCADKVDKQGRYINIYMPIYGKLAALYLERSALRKEKEEGGGKEKGSDREKAQKYGTLYATMKKNVELRGEMLAARTVEKLKLEEEEGEGEGEGGK